jgi:L-threonylcarbamoyladenylate synthase
MSQVKAPTALEVSQAAEALARGDLVAFPTETVYGLGARADDDAAVAGIYAAKGRPADHPLIVHVLGADQAAWFAKDLSADAQQLMATCWPGPLTLIVPRRDGVASASAGGHASVGLRCPSHPVARDLLAAALALSVPGVAAPSANRFGRVSPTRADHVRDELGPGLRVLDGGACELGIESTIVDLTRQRPVLLRPGVLTPAELTAASGVAIEVTQGRSSEPDGLDAAPQASGMLEAHYAPQAKVRLMPTRMLGDALKVLGGQGLKGLAVYSRTAAPGSSQIVHRVMPDRPRAAAHELFAVMRELDAQGVSLIWVETPPDEPAWQGVRDRLQRAAAASKD